MSTTNELSTPLKGLDVADWRPVTKGALLGFVTVIYGHVTIFGAMLMQSGGRTWINLPSKPRVNRDGTPLMGPNGKAVYEQIVGWTTRDGGDRIQAQLLELIRAKFPGALG